MCYLSRYACVWWCLKVSSAWILHSGMAWVHSHKLTCVCSLHGTVLQIGRTGKQIRILELPQLYFRWNNPLVVFPFILNQPPSSLVLSSALCPPSTSFYVFIPSLSNIWFVCIQCSSVHPRQCFFKGATVDLWKAVTTATVPWGGNGP